MSRRKILAIWIPITGFNAAMAIYQHQRHYATWPVNAIAFVVAVGSYFVVARKFELPRAHRLDQRLIEKLSEPELDLLVAVIEHYDGEHRVFPNRLREELGEELDQDSGEYSERVQGMFDRLVVSGLLIDSRDNSHDHWHAYRPHSQAIELLEGERERRLRSVALGPRSRPGALAS